MKRIFRSATRTHDPVGHPVRRALLPVFLGIALVTASAIVLGMACAPPPSPVAIRFVDPGADDLVPVSHAVAIVDSPADSDIQGVVHFEAIDENPLADGGLRMRARFSGLPGPAHGFHVHLLGDCRGEAGERAGTHFNFSGASRNPPQDIDRITGNLGVLEPDDAGEAQLEAEIEGARLHGRFSILGRSIIVHARANDPTKPPIGAAGSRIACGVIGLTSG